MEKTNKTLVLFDFDGTITFKDTFLEFIKFTHGKARFYAGFSILFPFLLLYKLGIIPNYKAKEIVLSWYYKNKSILYLEEQGKAFAKEKLPQLIRPLALKKIQEYKNQNAEIVIVSASIKEWLSAWCQETQIPLICTELETKNSLITGKLETPNCYGSEKVRRIKKEYQLHDFENIIAFGDSKGDSEMLAIANEKHYKPFRS